jgi:hypothetical protein
MRIVVVCVALAVGLGQAVVAVAAPPYDGFAAGEESYRYHEARRRQEIAGQLDTIDRLKWYAGQPIAPGVPVLRDPPSLDYIYGTGRWSRFGPASRGVLLGPDVFEPWPIVPGDIFGYPPLEPARQPVGFFTGQTGPNRWEYHPIFEEDLVPPTGTVTEPTWPRPAPQLPPRRELDEPPPIPAGERFWPHDGPREF